MHVHSGRCTQMLSQTNKTEHLHYNTTQRNNHRFNNNLQQDLTDRRMASPVDPVFSHHTSKEMRSAAVPELRSDQPHQSLKQSHAEDHTEQIEATSGEDHH